MIAFTCEVPGDPRGKGSVRVYNGRGVKDAATELYMGTAIQFMRAARKGPPIDGALSVTIAAYCRRPKALIPNPSPRVRAEQPPWEAFPATCKPDVDNLQKALLDSLTQAGVIVDDKNVSRIVVEKLYCAVGESPRVVVTVATVAGWKA